MNKNTQNKPDVEEVDLSAISKGVGDFFGNISATIFRAIRFVIKNIIVIVILFAIGVALGVYLDTTRKVYDNQIIVQPNFGSIDYLYAKIDLLDSKIKDNDTVFLKKLGMQHVDELGKIEIKPVMDVYRFINNSEQNYELLKLLAEDSDIKKIIEEKATSKNYSYHLISFKTKDKTSRQNIVEPLLKYLNNSAYYSKIQKEYINNQILKMKANELTIAQIDGFLNTFSNKVNGNEKNDKLVYYNENTQLNDVIITKDKLIKEQGNIRIDLVGLDHIVTENSSTLNIENSESINGKFKFILPIVFILMYLCIHLLVSFYRNQNRKLSAI